MKLPAQSQPQARPLSFLLCRAHLAELLEHGTWGLKSRSDPEELTPALAKIGELMMRFELAEHTRTTPSCSGAARLSDANTAHGGVTDEM